MANRKSSKGKTKQRKHIVEIIISLIISFLSGYFFNDAGGFSAVLAKLSSVEILGDGKAYFHFIDVGQGDSTLITSDGGTVMIDTGSVSEGDTVCDYITRFTESVDYLILTHPHEDHLYSEELEHRLKGFACEIGTPVLVIHGSADTLETIRRVTDRVPGFKGQDRVIYDIMKPYETRAIGRYYVTPLPAEHGTATPFVYLIEEGDKSFLLLNDTGRPSYEVYQYLVKRGILLDAISFDTTYGFENVLVKYGKADHHMGLLDNVAVKGFLDMNGVADRHTVCIANHFSHQGIDADYHKMAEHSAKYGFITSYDGLEIEV